MSEVPLCIGDSRIRARAAPRSLARPRSTGPLYTYRGASLMNVPRRVTSSDLPIGSPRANALNPMCSSGVTY